MVAGQDTGADTMIGLAGGTNAVRGYSGYKPLTSEAAVAAAPDLILLMDSGLESIGGAQGLWQLPGTCPDASGKTRPGPVDGRAFCCWGLAPVWAKRL